MALDVDLVDAGSPAEQAAPSTLYRSAELFSGAGGLALGTHRAGFRHELLLERDPEACDTLESNVASLTEPGIDGWTIQRVDARRFSFAEFADLDLIAGGAACQPFSVAGVHKGRQDPRNLLPEFIRAVREATPRAFLLENVDGLLRPGFARYFDYVSYQLAHPTHMRRKGEKWKSHLSRLAGLQRRNCDPAYRVVHAELNAADFGVPQARRRVFLVGLRQDVERAFHFPVGSYSKDRLLQDQWISGSYWERHELKRPSVVPTVWKHRLEFLRVNPPAGEPWRTARDAISDLPPPLSAAPARYPQHVLMVGARAYVGHTGSALDWPSKTIKAGAHGVPGGENMLRKLDGSVRYYTIREMARIQTFPDTWIFKGKWNSITKQLGNAVPVILGQAVAEATAAALGSVGPTRTNLSGTSARERSRPGHNKPHDGGSPK